MALYMIANRRKVGDEFGADPEYRNPLTVTDDIEERGGLDFFCKLDDGLERFVKADKKGVASDLER